MKNTVKTGDNVLFFPIIGDAFARVKGAETVEATVLEVRDDVIDVTITNAQGDSDVRISIPHRSQARVWPEESEAFWDWPQEKASWKDDRCNPKLEGKLELIKEPSPEKNWGQKKPSEAGKSKTTTKKKTK